MGDQTQFISSIKKTFYHGFNEYKIIDTRCSFLFFFFDNTELKSKTNELVRSYLKNLTKKHKVRKLYYNFPKTQEKLINLVFLNIHFDFNILFITSDLVMRKI